MNAATGPTGPEDPTPGAEVRETADQAEELVSPLGARRPYRGDSLLHRRRGSVRLLDRGAAYLEAQLIDPEWEVVKMMLLPPLSARESPASRRRWFRQQDGATGDGA